MRNFKLLCSLFPVVSIVANINLNRCAEANSLSYLQTFCKSHLVFDLSLLTRGHLYEESKLCLVFQVLSHHRELR